MNYSLIIDIRALFEHENVSKTLVDNSLNTLQKLCKLEIPSVIYTMMINSFETKSYNRGFLFWQCYHLGGLEQPCMRITNLTEAIDSSYSKRN